MTSGRYTIEYDGEQYSEEVIVESEKPSIKRITISTEDNISFDEDKNIYYLKNLVSTFTVNVEILNPNPDFTLKVGNATQSLQADNTSYSSIYTLDSQIISSNVFTVAVTLLAPGNLTEEEGYVTVQRIIPTVNTITIQNSVNDNDTYYLPVGNKQDTTINVEVEVDNYSDQYTLCFGSCSKPLKDNKIRFGNYKVSDGDNILVQILKDKISVYSKNITIKFASISIKGVSDSILRDNTYYTTTDTVTLSIVTPNPQYFQNIYLNNVFVQSITPSTSNYQCSYKFTETNKMITLTATRRNYPILSYSSASVNVYKDTQPPVVTVNNVSKVITDTENKITREPIQTGWTNSNQIAIEFAISDLGVGLNQDFALSNIDVKANNKMASKIDATDGGYIAYFDMDDADKISFAVSNVKDALGNTIEGNCYSTDIEIGIDTFKPVIKDLQFAEVTDNPENELQFGDYNSFVLLSGKSYKVRFRAVDIPDTNVPEETESAPEEEANDPNETVPVSSNIKECFVYAGDKKQLVTQEDGYYYATVTATNRDAAKVTIYADDNANNQSEKKSYTLNYNEKPSLNRLSTTVNDNPDRKVAKEGDVIHYSLDVSDPEENPVTVKEFVICIGNTEVVLVDRNETTTYIKAEEGRATVSFTVKAEENYVDLTDITVRRIVLSDGPLTENRENINQIDEFEDTPIKYYAPIKINQYQPPTLTVESDNKMDKTRFVCIGDSLTIGFNDDNCQLDASSNHRVNLVKKTLYYSIDDDSTDNNKTWHKVTDNPIRLSDDKGYPDKSKVSVKATYQLKDAAGNIADNEVILHSEIEYYAPIKQENVVITCKSDNTIDPTKYAKPNNKLIFNAKADSSKGLSEQHDLTFYVKIVSEKLTGLIVDDKSHQTPEIKDEQYKEDVADVLYSISVSDAAGQSFAIQQINSGIKYYAPIRLANEAYSSNENNNHYARNGSKLNFTARVSHKVTASEVYADQKRTFAATTVDDETTYLSFVFSDVTELSNGDVSPRFILKDDAGNSLYYASNYPFIEFDSISPSVSITPKLNGFLNVSFSCTAKFEDKNLYPEGMKFDYHKEKGNETISAMNTEDFAENDSEFQQSLSLSEEGTYKISASVTDKAGNYASDSGMTVTIDKTSPKLTQINIESDTVPIFKKGYIINDYLQIDEDSIKELICKLSDNSGTVDWDIKSPIETEGKKTISIMVTDMAGNIGKIDFEIFIDATEPKPVVKDSVSNQELTPEKENKFTESLNLSILLDSPHFANMIDDEFTTLKLLDADGNEIYNFITKDGAKQEYTYRLSDYGKYILVVEAKDHAIGKDGDDGNVYGPVNYYITFTDGSILDTFSYNPILFYSLLSLLAIALIGGSVFFILLFKKKKEKESE